MNQCTHTISVVDDSDIIRRTFRLLLEHAGYCVTDFASGKEFLNSGLEEPSDCILLDLEMPGSNGIEVLDAMQDLGCKMPVVLVVTGTNNTALLADADREFVTAILKKPVGSGALLAAVAGALD
jgi:two-component system response regulator FixJ